MIFKPTSIAGAFLVELEPHSDERGFFARSFCAETFRRAGLNDRLVQCSVSFNRRRGTLRGMHYQAAPFEEAKLVRCTRGRIYDVILDLRPESSSFRQWQAFELGEGGRDALYIPEGVAHGFQTLTDDAEVFYQISQVYDPDSARTVRWDDPALGITWPISDPILSDKDRGAR